MDHAPLEKQSINKNHLISMVALVLALLLPLTTPRLCGAGEFDFLTEHPGTFSATVTAPPYKNLLSKADAAAFKRNLERLRDLLAKQPAMQSPRGVDIIGYFRPHDTLPPSTRLPVPGFGYLRFHFHHRDRKSGKPLRICCTTDEIHVIVNDPDQGLDVFGSTGLPSRAFYEPNRIGEMAGYPLYRMDNGDEVIVLSRSATPPWIPVTREEYIKAELATWQKAAAETSLDTLSPQVVRRHQAALDGMSAEERRMQARHYPFDPFEPPLAPVGSDEGKPLVRTNPAWFDPALPRAAMQLVILRFNYSNNLNHDTPGPTEHGDIAPYRVWQALHTSDWREIGSILKGK